MIKLDKKIRVVLSTLLILGLVSFPSTAEATNTFPDPVLKIYAGFVNGIERDIILTQNSDSGEIVAYFKIGDEEPVRFGRDIDAGFDRYGAIWVVDKELSCVCWWSYDLALDPSNMSNFTLIPDPENPSDFLHDIDSLVYEETSNDPIVVGYKDSSGKTYPLLSFEEMRDIANPESSVSEPSYVPSPIETPSPSPSETSEPMRILKKYTGSVQGIERTLFLTDEIADEITLLLKIGNWNPDQIYFGSDVLDSGIDKYGTVQILCEDKTVFWWSYDLNPSKFHYNAVPNPHVPEGYMCDIKSFVFEGSGEQAIIVGYETVSGKIYPLPSFDEMKEAAGFDNPIQPSYVTGGTQIPGTPLPSTSTPSPMITATPVASVSPIQTPSASTSTPMATVTPTEKPTQVPATPTPVPAVSAPPTQAPPALTLTPSTPVTVPETPSAPLISADPNVVPTVTPANKKLVIEKSKKKGATIRCLCEGDKVVIEYSLKKGKLNWKAGKRKGTMKNVKYVVFIKKSRNLYVGDKKGRGYIISSKTGKKKLIIKKGAKKPICSGGFGIKVKRTSGGPISIINK